MVYISQILYHQFSITTNKHCRKKCFVNALDFNHIHFYFSKNDWSHREALILLREREAAGIFPVDKNFIDPSRLELPTDEELQDTPIYC